jgi:aspartate-semialdehyde dehydrogenase
MSGWPVVGVAGARGVVGGVFLSILSDAGLPAECLRAFGTESGELPYGAGRVTVHQLDEDAASGLEILFLATDGAISRGIVEGPGRRIG